MTVVLKKYEVADFVYDVKELKQVNELTPDQEIIRKY